MPKEMSKETAAALYAEVQPQLQLRFASYYKYMFYFAGEHAGIRVVVGYGGDSDTIYRYNVARDDIVFTPTSLDLALSEYMYVEVATVDAVYSERDVA